MNRVSLTLCRLRQPIGRIWRGYKVKAIDLQKNAELSLAKMIPDVVKFWNTEKNGDLTPDTIPFNYRGELWWKCPNGNDHIWSTRNASAVDVSNHVMRCTFQCHLMI